MAVTHAGYGCVMHVVCVPRMVQGLEIAGPAVVANRMMSRMKSGMKRMRPSKMYAPTRGHQFANGAPNGAEGPACHPYGCDPAGSPPQFGRPAGVSGTVV